MKKSVLSLVISFLFLFLIFLNMSNITVNAQTDLVPVFSHEGGFYSNPFTLTLGSSVPGYSNSTIYYTTDGSVPSPGSEGTNVYTNGIYIRDRTYDSNVFSMIRYNPPNDFGFGFPDMFNPDPTWREPDGQVFKGTPVRAMVVDSDGTTSDVVTRTYFLNPNMGNRYRLPVISITTDQENLFDEQIGLFVGNNVENSGGEWERPVHIEFYEADGTLGFAQNIGMRIHGGYTRSYQQKSLRLYCRSEYDEENNWFDYEIFPGYKQRGSGEQMERHKRLILRNSGTDWMNTMMRDGMMQSLMLHMSHDIQALRQSVVFINGEFWGIYNIRERFDDRYVQTHYEYGDIDIDRDNVAMLDAKVEGEYELDEGEAADLNDYLQNVLNFVRQNNMSNPYAYETLKTRIDIESFLDHYASEIYIANTDWPGNNMIIWRYNTDSGTYEPDAPYGLDGRWRYATKDTDFGFAISTSTGMVYGGQVNTDMIQHASTPSYGGMMSANWPDSVILFSSLLDNQEFRYKFINRLSDHLNTAFTPERVNSIIDELSSNIAYAIPEHNARWSHRIHNWEQEISSLRNFANNRIPYVRQHIQSHFGSDVNGTVSININTDRTRGYVRVNSIDIKESTPGISNSANWSGVYFDGVPITLTAVSEQGYKFERWMGVSGVNQDSATITFNPQNNMSITAVFSESGTGIPGDINSDGNTNSSDYILLRQYFLGMSDSVSNADLNGDGLLNSSDYILLRRYLLGIISSFSIKRKN